MYTWDLHYVYMGLTLIKRKLCMHGTYINKEEVMYAWDLQGNKEKVL